MDVLRPTLVRIGGRVYRKNVIHEQVQQQEEEDFYTGPSDCADEPCDAFVVEETEKGFQCRVEVPSPLYKYIIGKKGETKKRLETETRTSISIPKPGVEGEIASVRSSPSHTSCPSLSTSPSSRRSSCSSRRRCWRNAHSQITGGKPLSVEVTGVEYMNDDPAMMDVLYAKVHMKDGSDKLQMIADQLVERFVASGLMLREWDRVKLHATVMNTLFRKDPSGAEERSNTVTGKSSFKERESFNGRNILKLFENFSFGEAQLDAVLLSQRYSSDASGYYGTAGRLLLH
ncbi:activating signal cointegrator 1 complex subunit 1 isoform X3 [Lagopus leucura]|uniref:activating signal cointegrator 1 complex subunit 1 isoform X3 n=1 Tax=Lagopus leucura TaxID=30410 RepID=UPI001C664556|nr:activating signal cointegrator 1 complex subunit 1 isoform X3 [Lagopus leucura]